MTEEKEDRCDQCCQSEGCPTKECSPQDCPTQPPTVNDIVKIYREAHEAREKLLLQAERSIKTNLGRKSAMKKLTYVTGQLNNLIANITMDTIKLATKMNDLMVQSQMTNFHINVLEQVLMKKGLLTMEELQAEARKVEEGMKAAQMKAAFEKQQQNDSSAVPECKTCEACDDQCRCELLNGERVDDNYYTQGSPDHCPVRHLGEKEVEETEEEVAEQTPPTEEKETSEDQTEEE